MRYPILHEWLEKGLKFRWEKYCDIIITNSPKLSTNYAKCLAARVLLREFDNEYSEIYSYHAKKTDAQEFIDFVDECNFKMEEENFRNNIVEWSGTRWFEDESEIEKCVEIVKITLTVL